MNPAFRQRLFFCFAISCEMLGDFLRKRKKLGGSIRGDKRTKRNAGLSALHCVLLAYPRGFEPLTFRVGV